MADRESCYGTGISNRDPCKGPGTIKMSMQKCERCQGGWLIITDEFTCEACYGTGIVNQHKCYQCTGSGIHKKQVKHLCPHCDGTGKRMRSSL